MIDEMFTEEEKQAALDQAYRFLNQRFLSSYELRQKMKRKQIVSELIDYVEERLIYYDARTEIRHIPHKAKNETKRP